MDKARDARRGASRFSPGKPHKLFFGSDCVGGDFVHSEGSKKERLRRLSVVGRTSSSYEDSEMGCDVSDREDELRLQAPSMSIDSNKRFKIPKKFFDDCNGVDHASVPRKLRSAMKKRNRESISPPLPDSKKLNHTISGVEESPLKNGIKKSKLNIKHGGSNWSLEQTVSGPITKDEEEVVETLYALAGMFPNSDANEKSEKSKLDSESKEGKPLALPVFCCYKRQLDFNASVTAEVAKSSSNAGRSPKETAKVDSLNEPSIQEQLDLPDREKFRMDSDCSVPPLHLHNVPFLAKGDGNSVRPLRDSEISSEAGGLKLHTEPEAPLTVRKPEIALEPAIAIACELEQQSMIKEPKNGPALWPGSSSVASNGVGSDGRALQLPCLRSSAAKIPSWLDTAINASRPKSFENDSSSGKVSKVAFENSLWKRCDAHVRISRFIQILQTPENQERFQPQPNLLGPKEGSKLGVLMASNDFHELQGLDQDRPQAALAASQMHIRQKQSFDFLSLSGGGGGVEAKNHINRAANGFIPPSQLQSPYLQSLVQQQMLMPYSVPQARFTSCAYTDQISVAPYLSNPFEGPHASSTALTKQQQQLWAAQLAAQFRPAGPSTCMTQVPSWQQGRQDPSMLIPRGQAVMPAPPSSLDGLGPTYSTISQQQQHLMAISSSFPHTRVKKQEHLPPSVYEGARGGFHAHGALPLQLLCKERL
ncbi:hypothetical protein CJ030_MR8G002770 [Morella rubra]|uniref:Uncharacterized protein n=1 Tax=Morella rubra TaxID=262757 RepID=A0A6A1UT48_9ROSI|nr:hypothetical protein CJ030_MR8G002770 [Morella rubra]